MEAEQLQFMKLSSVNQNIIQLLHINPLVSDYLFIDTLCTMQFPLLLSQASIG
jgi:hypothetical protein